MEQVTIRQDRGAQFVLAVAEAAAIADRDNVALLTAHGAAAWVTTTPTGGYQIVPASLLAPGWLDRAAAILDRRNRT